MSGYVILPELACGHHALTQTPPPEGTWITCPVCQGQRKVTAAGVGEALFLLDICEAISGPGYEARREFLDWAGGAT